MTAHTPGPWHQNSYQVEADDGSLICHMSGWRGPKFTEANARLIAAAPELLEALREVCDANDDVAHPQWKDSPVERAARAAIAKAKGESDGR